MLLYTFTFFAFILETLGGRPEVKCPVPVSPENGQIFLSRLGTTVKYSCNDGFELKGSEIAICKDDKWFPEIPICEAVDIGTEKIMDISEVKLASSVISRPLFGWNNENNETNSSNKSDINDAMQSDGTNVQMFLYPRRQLTATPTNIRSASNLEEEEKRRSSAKQQPTPPSVLYVRRTWPHYYRAPMHIVVNNEEEITQTNNNARPYYYWEPTYSRSPLTQYETRNPVSMTLSESQLAWINSLHPETRDRYLRDLYEMRAKELEYATYDTSYPWISRNPYFTRQPLTEDSFPKYDYSCHRTERDGRIVTIKAPKLTNGYIYRYDRRKNPYHPYNDYLVAQYRCQIGFTFLDPNSKELYCSRSRWIGNSPICVRKI